MIGLLFAPVGPLLDRAAAAEPGKPQVPGPDELLGDRPARRKEVHPLLLDPLAGRPDLDYLRQRRRWLARRPADLAAFEEVARDFEERGAFFPAIEILWFAEKIAQEPERRRRCLDWMERLNKRAAEIEARVETAMQLWGAGRQHDGLDQLKAIIKQFPFCEKAHFRMGMLYIGMYRENKMLAEKGSPPEIRASLFGVCYPHFVYTTVIDPLYFDAYKQLSRLRELMTDDHEFLKQSQFLTERAADFQTLLGPHLMKLDEGDRSPRTLLAAGEGFEAIELYAYAVLAYQSALAQPDADEELKTRLRRAIEVVRAKHLNE